MNLNSRCPVFTFWDKIGTVMIKLIEKEKEVKDSMLISYEKLRGIA